MKKERQRTERKREKPSMRLFTATLATETNTFSPLPTSLENYRESVFLGPGEHPTDAPRMCTAPLMVGRARAQAEGFELIEGSCFAASPAGTTNRADYEFMRDEILDQLKAALPVDGAAARPARRHGGARLRRRRRRHRRAVRAIVGPTCVIGVELDPHCHLTMKRLSKTTDIIVLYKEFPHTDVVERAEDVLDLVLRDLARRDQAGDVGLRLPPDPELPTTLQPMRAFVDAHHGDGRQGWHSLRLPRPLLSLGDVRRWAPGSWWSPTATRRRPRASPTASAGALRLRGKIDSRTARAGRGASTRRGPSHGPGGDRRSLRQCRRRRARGLTDFLRHLSRGGQERGCLAPIWDPMAVPLCFDAGVGATIDLRIGGKTGKFSGNPVDVTATVTALAEESAPVHVRCRGVRLAAPPPSMSTASTSC